MIFQQLFFFLYDTIKEITLIVYVFCNGIYISYRDWAKMKSNYKFYQNFEPHVLNL